MPLELELLAGDIGGPGSLDGAGAAAHFYYPTSVAVDSASNVYVADVYNHTIRKVTAAGGVITLAGTSWHYAAQAVAVAGVGCAGVAVWLYLRQRSTLAEPDSSHAARLMLTPTASGIGIAGRF